MQVQGAAVVLGRDHHQPSKWLHQIIANGDQAAAGWFRPRPPTSIGTAHSQETAHICQGRRQDYPFWGRGTDSQQNIWTFAACGAVIFYLPCRWESMTNNQHVWIIEQTTLSANFTHRSHVTFSQLKKKGGLVQRVIHTMEIKWRTQTPNKQSRQNQ